LLLIPLGYWNAILDFKKLCYMYSNFYNVFFFLSLPIWNTFSLNLYLARLPLLVTSSNFTMKHQNLILNTLPVSQGTIQTVKMNDIFLMNQRTSSPTVHTGIDATNGEYQWVI
jgi:hypothetical protein